MPSSNGDAGSKEFRTVYCGGAPLTPEVGRTLPAYFTVDYTSPGALEALEAEVTGMPGVVGVRPVAG